MCGINNAPDKSDNIFLDDDNNNGEEETDYDGEKDINGEEHLDDYHVGFINF